MHRLAHICSVLSLGRENYENLVHLRVHGFNRENALKEYHLELLKAHTAYLRANRDDDDVKELFSAAEAKYVSDELVKWQKKNPDPQST